MLQPCLLLLFAFAVRALEQHWRPLPIQSWNSDEFPLFFGNQKFWKFPPPIFLICFRCHVWIRWSCYHLLLLEHIILLLCVADWALRLLDLISFNLFLYVLSISLLILIIIIFNRLFMFFFFFAQHVLRCGSSRCDGLGFTTAELLFWRFLQKSLIVFLQS